LKYSEEYGNTSDELAPNEDESDDFASDGDESDDFASDVVGTEAPLSRRVSWKQHASTRSEYFSPEVD
jgi:hypothetical protein